MNKQQTRQQESGLELTLLQKGHSMITHKNQPVYPARIGKRATDIILTALQKFPKLGQVPIGISVPIM